MEYPPFAAPLAPPSTPAEASAEPDPLNPPITPKPNKRPKIRAAKPKRPRRAQQIGPQHLLPLTGSSVIAAYCLLSNLLF